MIHGWNSRIGSKPSAQRAPATAPVAMPKKAGVSQSARSQPGPLKRRKPRRGGGGA